MLGSRPTSATRRSPAVSTWPGETGRATTSTSVRVFACRITVAPPNTASSMRKTPMTTLRSTRRLATTLGSATSAIRSPPPIRIGVGSEADQLASRECGRVAPPGPQQGLRGGQAPRGIGQLEEVLVGDKGGHRPVVAKDQVVLAAPKG